MCFHGQSFLFYKLLALHITKGKNYLVSPDHEGHSVGFGLSYQDIVLLASNAQLSSLRILLGRRHIKSTWVPECEYLPYHQVSMSIDVNLSEFWTLFASKYLQQLS